MRRVNHLKAKINAGTPVVGVWLGLADTAVAEITSRAGYDFLIIDSEHGGMELQTSTDMMRAAAAGDAEALVRVPSHDPNYLKRILDAGATSLMIPMVNTADQARAIVDACRYPPHGSRGFAAPAVRASRYGEDADYIHWAHEELFITAQIETIEAVENAEEIASVDGIDMLFVGVGDLSGSFGKLTETACPEVEEALIKIKAAAKKHGKTVGTIPRPGVPTSDLPKDGFLLGAGAVDTMMLRAAALADVEAFRKVNG